MPPLLRAVAFTLAIGIVQAQAPSNPPLKFEVASVRRADPAKKEPPFEISPGGRLRATVDLKFLIEVAYSVRDHQIVGAPKWIDAEDFTIVEFKLRLLSGRIVTSGGGAKVAMLAVLLMNEFHRPVIDKTGLDGLYAFDLTYNPDESKQSDRPSLFTALQEQLGLKLEAKKGEGEVLVIDRLERPSEN
jgi:hypothetical protein